MKILILNVGSTTIKWSVFDSRWKEHGLVENVKDFGFCLDEIMNNLKLKYSFGAVAHRIVHGGELKKNIALNLKTINYLKSLEKFAPLHQKNEIKGVEIAMKIFPKAKQIGILDTVFHSTIPEKAKIYAIPIEFYKKGIKRYGFHGSSHKYVSESLKGKAKKLVSCHLGAGCSITAIQNGRSIDTSMGFTPLEGVVMVTRSGSIDPGIMIYLKNENLQKLLNEKSGVYGISGKKDFRDVLKSKDKNSRLAVEVFCYSVAKCIGSYAAAMRGLDAVAFTGGIGENSSIARNKIIDYIKFLKPKVFIIKSDEREIMLKEALKLT